MSNFIEVSTEVVQKILDSYEEKMNSILTAKKIRGLEVRYLKNSKYFEYSIDDKSVSREEAKDHLERQKTKLAELL